MCCVTSKTWWCNYLLEERNAKEWSWWRKVRMVKIGAGNLSVDELISLVDDLAIDLSDSCFSWLSVKILAEHGIQTRIFCHSSRRESCLGFKMKRILSDWSGKIRIRQESQDIWNFLECRQVSFCFFFTDSCLIWQIIGTWCLCAVCIYIYIVVERFYSSISVRMYNVSWRWWYLK